MTETDNKENLPPQKGSEQPQPLSTPTPAPTPPPAPAPAGNSGAGHVDLGKVLLPKKPGAPSTASAQRVNAGALLQQEEQASLATTPAPAKAQTEEPAPATPPASQKKEDSIVKPIQTYRGDIESVVQDKNVSVVSIAAKEAERREQGSLSPKEEGFDDGLLRKAAYIAGGILLLTAAAGFGAYVFFYDSSVPGPEQMQSPFIHTDKTEVVVLRDGDSRTTFAQALENAKENTSLSLGLVQRLLIAKPQATPDAPLQEVSARETLSTLSPNLPDELSRSLEPTFLLGIHSFDENQPFFILRADSYQTAYAGMLQWENTMVADLSPLFGRTPRPRIPEEVPVVPQGVGTALPQGTFATSSDEATTTPDTPVVATSTATTTSATSTPSQTLPPVALPTLPTFVDRIIQNRDTRVIQNDAGDILLLWTFLDRNTIVITTNEYTLREVISRIQNAPIVPIPTQ